MEFVGLILGGLAAVVLIAALRAPTEHLLNTLFGLPASLLGAGRDVARDAREGVEHIGDRTRSALAYGHEPDGLGPAWDVAAPLVYLVLLVVILCGDVVLASLRFGALLGIPVGDPPVDGPVLDLLTGLLFLAVLATYGGVLLDLAHVTPLRRPYGLVTGRPRRTLTAVAVAGTALCAVGGVLFFVWGQYAIFGDPNQELATLFVAIFAALLVGASILAAGGAHGCVLALWVLLCAVTATALAVLAALLHLLTTVLNGAREIVVSAVRLLAHPGTVLWNWLADLPVGTRMRLRRLPEPRRDDPATQEQRIDVDLAGGP